MGTELIRRGVPLPDGPDDEWSAWAIRHAPDEIARVHTAYARAGAMVHVAATFRTQPRIMPTEYVGMTQAAVEIARIAALPGQRVAGSLAPIMDCYRPDLSPDATTARGLHAQMARALADSGVDVIICETFPHAGEALIAVEESVRTGTETWLALTGGPDLSLMSPAAIGFAGVEAARRGASAVLVNCVAATRTFDAVLSIRQALDGAARSDPELGRVRVGAYANAGPRTDHLGWDTDAELAAQKYAQLAQLWVQAGATIVGSCCGTGPAHTRALRAALVG